MTPPNASSMNVSGKGRAAPAFAGLFGEPEGASDAASGSGSAGASAFGWTGAAATVRSAAAGPGEEISGASAAGGRRSGPAGGDEESVLRESGWPAVTASTGDTET